MSIYHKALVASEGGFAWFSRDCSCDREAVALIEQDVAADLVARALRHGLWPPLGKPRRNLAYAYFGGGVSRQPTEITSIVRRTRQVGLTAAVITAIKLVSKSLPGKDHVEFHEDIVISALDVEPLHRAVHRME
ncbi:MAG: hypothetical protein ACKPKO_07880, partial [Candidatus Fonsibacter sp.]